MFDVSGRGGYISPTRSYFVAELVSGRPVVASSLGNIFRNQHRIEYFRAMPILGSQ
jgi:hypothetical protein